MKLDSSHVRDISPTAYKVLGAVEIGSRNHLNVPLPLIASLSGVRAGGQVKRFLYELAKIKLVGKVNNTACKDSRDGH